jgi:hypothetical protein
MPTGSTSFKPFSKSTRVQRLSVKEISTSVGERPARIGRARLGIRGFPSTTGTISSILTKIIVTTFVRKCQRWERRGYAARQLRMEYNGTPDSLKSATFFEYSGSCSCLKCSLTDSPAFSTFLYRWVLMSNHIHLVIIEDQVEGRRNEKDIARK